MAVIAAFHLVQLGWSAPAKYAATAVLTISGTWLIYGLLVCRLAALRLLFGMAPKPAAAPKPWLEAA